LKIVAQDAWGRIRFNRFVHAPAIPPRDPTVVQTQLIVRVPVRGADPSSQIPGHSRYAITAAARPLLQKVFDFGGEVGADPFVRVERQDPVVRRKGGSVVLLRAIT